VLSGRDPSLPSINTPTRLMHLPFDPSPGLGHGGGLGYLWPTSRGNGSSQQDPFFFKCFYGRKGRTLGIVVADAPGSRDRGMVGKTLEQISAGRGISSEEVILEILCENRGKAVAIFHAMADEDVERAMVHSASNRGQRRYPGNVSAPPGLRKLSPGPQQILPRRGLFPLEEAVRKMTSAPAKLLKLDGRGRIESGCFADLLVFDPAKFRGQRHYENPKQFASGLDWMFVNGNPVLREGKWRTFIRGEILKKS